MRGWGIAAILACALQATAAEETFRVVSKDSTFEVKVGRAGFLKMFGHDHVIRVSRFDGTVQWDDSHPDGARFEMDVDAGSLTVADEDVDVSTRSEIQADMESEALALSSYPRITFRSEAADFTRAGEGVYEGTLRGTLELRGVRETLDVPLTVTRSGPTLEASGSFELDGRKWGVPQISAVGGTVKTKNELELTFEIVATTDSE